LNDSLTALVMRRDNLRRADVIAAVEQARRQMRPEATARHGYATLPPARQPLGGDLLRLS